MLHLCYKISQLAHEDHASGGSGRQVAALLIRKPGIVSLPISRAALLAFRIKRRRPAMKGYTYGR